MQARILEVGAYPAVTALALAGYSGALAIGLPPSLAAYLVVALAVLCIALHEIVLPERAEWRPAKGEAAADLAFLAFVQMLLAQVLSLLAALTLADLLRPSGLVPAGLWPTQWSPWLQLVLLTVLAEFPRYWFHRLSHNFTPLWRLHAASYWCCSASALLRS